ncbi:MAG: hypothetical protein JXA21_01440 [Anaerolineae bacterium]|nr:hypothetical protein [Anaerolineae bacterium]
MIHDLLNKLADEESAFLDTEFLAPVLPGGQVRVRIAGVICTLRVIGEATPGWAILKPLSMEKARIVGQPGIRQVREYLNLFPAVRFLLLAPSGNDWLALPAQRGDTRFQTDGPVHVHLVTGVQAFQRIIARFEGTALWFQEIDRRRNPAIAAYLREALAAETPPEALHKPTLTAEEREVYCVLYAAIAAARRDQVEVRLADALAHAGARLSGYIERPDVYTLTYTVDGQTHRSSVRKDDLTVLSAGICLSGQDRRFDLQSLVSVIREGAARQRIVRVGEEEEEWD